MADLNPQPLPPRSEIRVNVTREIAFDLKKSEQVRAAVLSQLGCPRCTSGHVIDFHIVSEFVVNPDTLNVSPVISGSVSPTDLG